MIRFQGRNKQRGIVIVALLLLFTLAATLAVVTPTRGNGAADRVTRSALSEARQALLGYAAAYPDRVNQQFGPGYLPCPARDARGIAGPACGVGSATTRGRFPWHTLRTNDLRDGAGEPLWYALSESHRYNPKHEPLNSAAAPVLALDGDAVVAVLLAPGAPLPGQRRRRLRPQDAHEFLEAANGDADVTRYQRGGAGAAINDQVLAVTQREFLHAIEARVLGEVALRLRRYAVAHGDHYPWLSSAGSGHADELAEPARARIGWLPFHYAAEDWTAPHGQTFTSELSVAWAFSAAAPLIDDPDVALDVNCLLSSSCAGSAMTAGGGPLHGPAVCRWWSPAVELAPREFAHCELVQQFAHGADTYAYEIAFAIRDGDGEIEVDGPRADAPRTRRIATQLPFSTAAPSQLFIRITLRMTAADGRQASAVLTASAATHGYFAVAGIRYAVDVNHGELPAWLVRNRWLDEIRLAWAASDCASTASCLSVRASSTVNGVAPRAVRALAVSAGTPLAGAPARVTGAPLAAWFEAANRAASVARPLFDALPHGPDFNDTVRVIEPAP